MKTPPENDSQISMQQKILQLQEEIKELKREKEMGDNLLQELIDLFGWSDKSMLHAVLHIRNAVLNLRADAAAERTLREIDKLTSRSRKE